MSDELGEVTSAPQGLGQVFMETPDANSQGANEPRTDVAAAPESAQLDWRNQLSENYRESRYLKNYKDLDSLAKSHEVAQKTLGTRFENMSEEQMRTYSRVMSVPEQADGYKFAVPEELNTEGLNADWFKSTMFNARIPQKEANELYNAYAKQVHESQTKAQMARETQIQDAQAFLKKEYGDTLPNKLQAASRLVEKLAGADFVKEFNESDLGTNPKALQFLIGLTEKFSEDAGVDLPQSQAWGASRQQAQERIRMLQGDPEFLRKLERTHPEYQNARAEYDKLFAIGYPD